RPERALAHLEGSACSRPVRVGNAAAEQRQVDIYGEVLLAAELQFCRAGWGRRGRPRRAGGRPLPQLWSLLRGLVEQAAARWQEPDHGIWEVRGGPQHFLHSKLMCWAALDRGIKLAGRGRLRAPLERWRRTRAEIRRAILDQGYSEARGAFTQAFGSPALDAGALQIARIGFLPARDPRVRSTVRRIAD